MKYYLSSLVLILIMSCSGDYTEEVEALNVQMEILSANSPLVKVSLVRKEKEVTNDGEGLQIFGTTERCEINTYSTSFLYDVSKESFIEIGGIGSLYPNVNFNGVFYKNDTMLFELDDGGATYLEGEEVKKYDGLSEKRTLYVRRACHSEDLKFKKNFMYINPIGCVPNSWFYENFESGERSLFSKNSDISYTTKSRCEGFLKEGQGEDIGMLYFDGKYLGYLVEDDSVIACIHNDERLIDSTVFKSKILSSLNEVKYVDGKVYGFDSLGSCKQLEQKSVSEFEVLSDQCDIYDSRLGWESESVVFDSVMAEKKVIPSDVDFWESRRVGDLKQVGHLACD